MKKAWGCVVSTLDYLLGAYNLFISLQKVNTKYNFILILDNTITFEEVFNCGFPSDISCYFFDNLVKDLYNKEKQTINKIMVYQLVEYDKIGLIDADIEIIKNIDHYLDFINGSAFINTGYSYGYQDENYAEFFYLGMNGSILIITPSSEVYQHLLFIAQQSSNDEEIWFKYYPNFMYQPWKHLPVGDWRGSKEQIRLIHYDGFPKPWMK